MEFKFYKEPDNRWYVDLPTWTGGKKDLELVEGADSMLEFMSEGKDTIWLKLSEENFHGSNKLEFIRLDTEIENGAYYKLEHCKGVKIDLEMWLCDVTKFIFGHFPKTIYISNV